MGRKGRRRCTDARAVWGDRAVGDVISANELGNVSG